ncbi:carboxyl transferase domain-containing protein [Nostocoides sp. HKS02]|uniref:acetyl-coenzyme A carboxylase carboxyl transferase subunits beta/alpha n=1 Tax=Nostocoides sp. HKS02 TaxID=1813880 RepID=UPI0012B45B21|nr:carboxyl transferase domain-containing protein [Tetrasphaera sp. HKS02]QGN56565.1 acetyl-CoA carboxyl transferase [Tetrasphaera sp. HKS02]
MDTATQGTTGRRERLGALELVTGVLDPGSWARWDGPVPEVAPAGSAYAAELAAARDRSGVDEAIVTGEGLIRGRRVAVIAGEFRFLAGSIGGTAAERIVEAFERARREELPLFAAPASGGTRMQEGTPAFVGMVKISAACATFKDAGLPYLVYLRHPTTGGVFASWGSLGHVTVAEPGATIGFLGARVYESLYGHPFPEGVQTAENLFEHGLIDAILPVEELAEVADRALAVLGAPREDPPEVPDVPKEPLPDLPAWESVSRSRRVDRPGVRALLRLGATDVLPLHGTGQGEYDPGMLMALARFGGAACIVLGQDRDRQTRDEPLSPKGLRVARRGMKLAHELGLPLVSVIDTAGAALSKEAEEGGLAGEIARCLAELVMLDAPTVCVLLGQGTGGGALAVMPADRVISAQHSWLSPLPPEGASAILHRDTSHAAELAASQRVRSLDLLADGIVDRIVAERPDAADEPEDFCRRMSQAIQHELAVLARQDPRERLAARLERYRRLG